MVASPSPRSLTITTPPHRALRAVDAVLGGFLELVIHSVEGLRTRLGARAGRGISLAR